MTPSDDDYLEEPDDYEMGEGSEETGLSVGGSVLGLPQMNDDDLYRILDEEEADATSYYDSELAQVQADAMDRLYAKPYNDGSELPNRSKAVTHDIEDAINWMMPHLMRAITTSDELITCDDHALDDDDQTLTDAQDYLRHVVFKDNDGKTAIHDFIFDALLQRTGIMRAAWEEPEPKPPMVLEGLTGEQVVRYHRDPEYTIMAAAIDGVVENDEQEQMQGKAPQEPTFSIQVLHRPKMGRAVIEAVAPEDFRISRRAKSIESARYHGFRVTEYLSELIIKHPHKAHELDPGNYVGTANDDLEAETDPRRDARFEGEPSTTYRGSTADEFRKEVTCHVEYVRCDFDGDGIVELRRVKRCGNIILENDAVEESEFVAWSPLRVSHKAIGRSIADTLLDIQRIRTALLRRGLDSLSRSLAPRTVVNRSAFKHDPSMLDRFLDHDVGDVLEVDGDPNQVVREMTTPDVSGVAFQALEYMDQRGEEASGVTRAGQGVKPQAITDTKGGIENLQAAANSRIEMVAQWCGHGLEKVFSKVLRLLIRHQDHARVVKINGRRMMVDPRRWSEEMTVSVHVGTADSREKRIVYLNALAQKQEQILMQAGPSNPLVTLQEYRNTLAEIASAMGYRNTTKFFRRIDPNWQPPDPGQDPKAIEAQTKAQLAQSEMQAKLQLQTAELQAKQQMAEKEAVHKQELARFEAEMKANDAQQAAELQRQIAEQKSAMEREIAALKIASEEQMARLRMEMEERLANQRMAQEMALAHQKLALGQSGGADGFNSYREGGRLDA